MVLANVSMGSFQTPLYHMEVFSIVMIHMEVPITTLRTRFGSNERHKYFLKKRPVSYI